MLSIEGGPPRERLAPSLLAHAGGRVNGSALFGPSAALITASVFLHGFIQARLEAKLRDAPRRFALLVQPFKEGTDGTLDESDADLVRRVQVSYRELVPSVALAALNAIYVGLGIWLWRGGAGSDPEDPTSPIVPGILLVSLAIHILVITATWRVLKRGQEAMVEAFQESALRPFLELARSYEEEQNHVKPWDFELALERMRLAEVAVARLPPGVRADHYHQALRDARFAAAQKLILDRRPEPALELLDLVAQDVWLGENEFGKAQWFVIRIGGATKRISVPARYHLDFDFFVRSIPISRATAHLLRGDRVAEFDSWIDCLTAAPRKFGEWTAVVEAAFAAGKLNELVDVALGLVRNVQAAQATQNADAAGQPKGVQQADDAAGAAGQPKGVQQADDAADAASQPKEVQQADGGVADGDWEPEDAAFVVLSLKQAIESCYQKLGIPGSDVLVVQRLSYRAEELDGQQLWPEYLHNLVELLVIEAGHHSEDSDERLKLLHEAAMALEEAPTEQRSKPGWARVKAALHLQAGAPGYAYAVLEPYLKYSPYDGPLGFAGLLIEAAIGAGRLSDLEKRLKQADVDSETATAIRQELDDRLHPSGDAAA